YEQHSRCVGIFDARAEEAVRADPGRGPRRTITRRVGHVIPNLNRRDALGAIGLLGVAAAAASASPKAARSAQVEVGSYVRRPGVQGRMTGAQAAAAALSCEGAR